MLIWNDYCKYKDMDLGLLEKPFGALCRDGDFSFPKYPFYADEDREHYTVLKQNFEEKFKLHFKYNQIAYESVEMFTDHFKDIMQLNYPKYLHYYKVLQKTSELKWWNNKDFVVTLDRELNSTNISNFTTIMERMDNFMSNMIRTGDITTDFERNLTTANNETAGADNTNELKQTGSNRHAITKNGDITTDFTRELTSTEIQKNNDSSRNNKINTNSSTNNTDVNSSDEKTSNSTTKNLDTPQGTLDNLMSNVNAYMTSGTVDSSRETDRTTSNTKATSEGKSEDITLASGTENKDIKGTEGGTTKNVENFNTTDTDVETRETTDTTKETLSSKRDTNITEEGTTQNKETRNTKDALQGEKTGRDETTKEGSELGKDKETFTRKEEGNIGVTSAGQLVEDWLKKGYINIDKMIIRDCEELFLQVY